MPDCLPAWDSFSPTSSPAAGFRSQVLPVLPVNQSRIMYLRGNPRWALGLGLGILPFWHLNTPWNKILWYDFFLLGDVLFVGRSAVSGPEAFSSDFQKYPKESWFFSFTSGQWTWVGGKLPACCQWTTTLCAKFSEVWKMYVPWT